MFDTKKKVKFNVQFRTAKLFFFTSNKDKTPFHNNPYVVYDIGKTETTLFKRTKEQGWQQKDSAVLGNFKEYNVWHHITKMFECMGKEIDQKEIQINNARRKQSAIIFLCCYWID